MNLRTVKTYEQSAIPIVQVPNDVAKTIESDSSRLLPMFKRFSQGKNDLSPMIETWWISGEKSLRSILQADIELRNWLTPAGSRKK
eukprot:snap_masked-scaffold_1-processed-gene-13.31-mRNA-1 protein AED:1.00 eAED:1.00 QI:0/-1/0/0/-1/1/1/0/85